MTRPTITAEQFDETAAHCGRWADKSLAIARALIVDGIQLSEVAKQHDCTPAYANTVRARFYDKAQAVRLASFKQQVQPDVLAALKPYGKDITKLADEGFNTDQLVDYLKRHSVSVSAEAVQKYLRAKS